MRSDNSHPILAGIGVFLLLTVLAALCWLAGAEGDLLPAFLPVGALPVTEDMSFQMQAGSLAVFERDLSPEIGRAVAFRAQSGTLLGWVNGLDPLTVTAGSDLYILQYILGTVTWSIDYLGTAVLLLHRLRWLVWGLTAAVVLLLIWLAATAKRRRHARKVRRMLETFERTARRYETDEEDF